jgi:hypothetical protein
MMPLFQFLFFVSMVSGQGPLPQVHLHPLLQRSASPHHSGLCPRPVRQGKEKDFVFWTLSSPMTRNGFCYFELCTRHLHDEESICSTDQAHLIAEIICREGFLFLPCNN